jgi:transposase
MGRRKLPYPPEFREEAVRLIREGGKSIGQVAKDLGISDQSLRNWVKQSDLDTGRRTNGLTTEERIELRRLRRENRVLREFLAAKCERERALGLDVAMLDRLDLDAICFLEVRARGRRAATENPRVGGSTPPAPYFQVILFDQSAARIRTHGSTRSPCRRAGARNVSRGEPGGE